MSDAPDPVFDAQTELAFLRALCADMRVHTVLEAMMAELADYKWHDAEYAIVYQALSKVATRDKRPLREQLPAIATRMGFPDVNWDHYFGPHAPPRQGLFELLRKLAPRARQHS
jgi:hypothetical protein